MRFRHAGILALCLVCLLLSGCWDYVEIEALDFVLGLGVDQIDPEYVVVMEMAKTSGGGQQASVEPKVLATKGQSVSSAGRALSNPAGLRAIWSHAYVFLISEQVAQDGILPAVEYIVRSRNTRSTIWVFITRDCTAEEVFKSKPPMANSVSEHLNAVVLMQETISGFLPLQVWELHQELADEGVYATLPTVRLVHEQGELVPLVEGTAVLKDDKMIGWLDGHESDIFCLLKGILQRGHFVIDTRVEDKGRFPITYELVGNQLQAKPVFKDGEISMFLSLDMQFAVEEMGRAPLNFRDEKMASSVEAQLATAFQEWVEELFWKLQHELNADVLGFGRLFKRKEPEAWRRFGKDWDTNFRNLPVDVEVTCQVVVAGLSSEPINVRD